MLLGAPTSVDRASSKVKARSGRAATLRAVGSRDIVTAARGRSVVCVRIYAMPAFDDSWLSDPEVAAIAEYVQALRAAP